MSDPVVPVGFDYSKALLEVREFMTYDEIAEYLGYGSKASILQIIRGTLPAHPQGEAIWVLYRSLFARKPPLTDAQRVGEPEKIHNSAPIPVSSSV